MDIYATNNIYNARIEAANTQLGGDGKVRLDITGSEEKSCLFPLPKMHWVTSMSFQTFALVATPIVMVKTRVFELQSAAFVDITVRFQQPCSQISLGAPLNQFVVNRVNTGKPMIASTWHLKFMIWSQQSQSAQCKITIPTNRSWCWLGWIYRNSGCRH